MLPLYSFVLLFLLSLASSAELYPYGAEEADQEISFSNDASGVSLDVPIVYFEEAQNELFISSNGVISFGKPIPGPEVKDLDSERTSAIAVYYTPANGGTVYWRGTSSDDNLLNDLTDKVRKNFPAEASGFRALHAILITWDGVTAPDANGFNQFQLAIATDGLSSYAVMVYNRLDWVLSDGRLAQAGLYFWDGRRQTMVNSGTPSVRELMSLSNNQKEGTHIFRISGSSAEDPRASEVIDDDYQYNDYEPEYDSEDDLAHQRQPPMRNHPDPRLSENHVNHNLEPVYNHMQPSHNYPQEPVRGDMHAGNALDEQPADGRHTNELGQYPSAQPEVPIRSEPAMTHTETASETVDRSRGHTYDQQSRYQQPIQPAEEDLPPDYSRGDAPPSYPNVAPLGSGAAAQSCAVASETMQPCHTNARCSDYHPGYCCECLEGYYGNGKECLKSGDPQRISGTFEGGINGEEVSRTELHTYVMAEEGRTYTAFSQIPAELGRSLLLINPIASAMGWLFAKVESPTSYNGFQLTGGVFNRTVNIHIGDRSAITIKQQFSGRDVYHYFKAQMFVTGTLPRLSEGVEVVYPDHEEEYRREGPGFVRSYSTHEVLVKENNEERTMRLTVDQQIHFNECPFRTFDKDSLVVLRMSRPQVNYDSTERIVRYAGAHTAHNERSPNVVETAETEPQQTRPDPAAQATPRSRDPCAEGNHLCTLPNMFCTVVTPSYRCECQKGFQAELDASVTLGWRCADLNECERGDHTCDQNAVCTNTDGAFTCECKPGYDGDGHRCYRVGEAAVEEKAVSGGGCESHQECHQWGECVFGRNGQPGVCKCRGWYVGDGVNHCGPPEEQPQPAPTQQQHQLQPQQRGLCGGYTCDTNADCMPSTRGGDECVCRAGHHGDGVQCEPHVQTAKPMVSVGGRCGSHDECGEHGQCVYGNDERYYRCVCVPPYTSDGMKCVAPGEAGPNQPPQYCDTLYNCGVNAQCMFDIEERHYACKCMQGFEGDGYACTYVRMQPQPQQPQVSHHTCREASDCHRNAHCVVLENSYDYHCECLPGFRGDGVTQCQSADECNPSDAQGCHQHAECVYGQVESAYVCKCIQGYAGDGRTCTVHARPSSCDEEPTVCHVNAQCVYSQDEDKHICICKPGSAGDGYANCELQEAPRCGRCSSHARCVEKANGAWACECNPGYQGNGQVCSPFTSCLDDRSLCDSNAECVPGEHGYYVCNCNYGYHGNGRSCSPDSENREEVLLIGRGMTVIMRGTNPEIHGKQLVVVPHQIVVGIDFDCQEERIVWSDISGHALRSASLNGTDERKLLESILESPEGIAVDWSSRNVYYADSNKDEIGVASLDGKYQKTLLSEGLVNPRALALDAKNKHLYYSDWHRKSPVIGRMDMDGKNNMPFVTTDIYLPNGLVVLEEHRELCWVDAGMQRLSCIGLDGRNRRVVYAPLEYPFGLASFNEQRFYWTDWKDNQIHSVSLYGDGYVSFPATIGGSGRMYGIASVPLQCKGTPSACAMNNGGCDYMCLPGSTQVHCVCPDNVQGLEGC